MVVAITPVYWSGAFKPSPNHKVVPLGGPFGSIVISKLRLLTMMKYVTDLKHSRSEGPRTAASTPGSKSRGQQQALPAGKWKGRGEQQALPVRRAEDSSNH